MSWISNLKSSGHITEALYHFNQAMAHIDSGQNFVEVARSLFNTMNKIQTEWILHQTESIDGEVNSFKTMINKTLAAKNLSSFLGSQEVRDLVFFEPLIMDHNTLRRNRYRPDQELEPELARKAGRLHHKVVNAYQAYNYERSDENAKRMIKRMAELLYVVRSNIAHGEKTPYGPDLRKRERDEEVCKAVAPIQLLLLNALLDSPQTKLVVYGTLAPGNINDRMLSELQGTWEDCEIKGYLIESGGLPFFKWEPVGSSINARLFISDDLPGYWERLDQFEGTEYNRILIPVNKSDGICIANIYEMNK